MPLSKISLRIPISMETLIKAESLPHGVPLLVYASVLACGGLDYVIGRSLIVFYDRDLEAHYRADLPSSLDGTASRKRGRDNIKGMKSAIRREFGHDFIRRLRDNIERMENE